MAAEITSQVDVTVHTPSGPITGTIGTVTYELTDAGNLDQREAHKALGALLTAAGEYLSKGGALVIHPATPGGLGPSSLK
ncbi:hypothetical protein ACIQCF_33170 [Streptomyces sp. NPDC088353]|uniref:hypothetical protein n=1 Tax=Streptomyces sp. NPDC088353 TaxID=3365855 RepID=UPI00382F5C9C